MRLSWLFYFVGSLLNLGTGIAQAALPIYYTTQGFTPPGGCGTSTAGSLNVIVSLPVPAGSNELEIRQVSYALRGTTSQPSTMKISANGYQTTANPQTGSTTCCSASSCDLAAYTTGTLGQTWYESPCGKPTCGTAQQWYKLSFPSNSIFYSGVTSVSVNVDFNGGFIDLANFGSGSSFFISYYVYYPSPSPTPTPTRTNTVTPTPTPTSTSSQTSTMTSTVTPTSTVTSSTSPSATASASVSATISVSATASASVSTSPSVSVSAIPTVTPSISSSPSTSITPSHTTSPSSSASASSTSSASASPSPGPYPSPSSSPSATSSSTTVWQPSSTSSPSATKSVLLVSSAPTMSTFSNSTMPVASTDGSYDTATILSGTTVGITGIALLTYVFNYLRRSGALNVLRSLGIPIPVQVAARTEEEKQAEAAGANTVLGKAATLITKAKEERKEILKVVDSLPLPEQLKYAAHNPKSLLSKSAQNRIETAERDLEKALPPQETKPQVSPEALLMLQQLAGSLGVKLPVLPAQILEKTVASSANPVVEPTATDAEEEEIDEEEVEQQPVEEASVPTPALTQAPMFVTPDVVASAATAKKEKKAPGSRAKQDRKAMLEVNEAELAEIKLILANKKKAFNIV